MSEESSVFIHAAGLGIFSFKKGDGKEIANTTSELALQGDHRWVISVLNDIIDFCLNENLLSSAWAIQDAITVCKKEMPLPDSMR